VKNGWLEGTRVLLFIKLKQVFYSFKKIMSHGDIEFLPEISEFSRLRDAYEEFLWEWTETTFSRKGRS
jgi:hypothetical protein